MKTLHIWPNEEVLHSVEDELFQYTVDNPGENWSIMDPCGSAEFYTKMDELISYEPYYSACERRSIEEAEKYENPLDVVKEFVEKFPQWKGIFYY